mmetsp:Transcript_67333/g.185563  ORF Transcript_67333/g.185563 Transcript_67333/m.185563 type:complete len:256 (-) Transcript_67333:1959-2726(-)
MLYTTFYVFEFAYLILHASVYLGIRCMLPAVARIFPKRMTAKMLKELHANAHLLAHQCTCIACCVVVGVLSLAAWFGAFGDVHHELATSSKLHMEVPTALIVLEVNLAFQVYDLIATLLLSELRSTTMVAHHVVAGGAAYLVLESQDESLAFLQLHSLFFFGITELSTIPLAIHDGLKKCPQLLEASFILNTINEISKPLFALSFLFIRVFWWALVALPIILTGKLPAAVAFALVFMTGLQWMWGYKVQVWAPFG